MCVDEALERIVIMDEKVGDDPSILLQCEKDDEKGSGVPLGKGVRDSL